MAQGETQFAGPVPEIYDRSMVPLLFVPFAEDMAARVAALAPKAVLETAAGSGVVTRTLAPQLGAGVRYVASDLNPPMLERAMARQAHDGRIEWRVIDAMRLPFDPASFDVVFCQFGVMFFPDRPVAYAEARRVLKPGAPFLFSTWDSLAENEVSRVVWEAVLAQFPDDPPDFFPKGPHGYFDEARIRADLVDAGFRDVTVERVTRSSPAPSAREAAVALCTGTPLRMQIIARDPLGLAEATDRAEAALRAVYGTGPITGKTQALIAVARG